MSRTHAIILFLLWTVQSLAQTTLSGTVTNEDGKALARVVCRLKNSNDSLLAYGFTNQQGRFSLPTNSSGSLLEFSAMGYAETRQPVLSGMTSYAVTLRKKEIEQEEVTVTVAPIRRDNDTLSYNVSASAKRKTNTSRTCSSACRPLNAGMAYDLTKGVAIELSGINLLNRKSYQESRYDGANRSYYSVPLRHREVMLGLRMRF